MLTSRQKQMLQEIPKAENHIHIEGSIPWALALELAEKNHVKLPVHSTEEIAVWSQDLISRKGLDGFMICDRTLNSVCLHEEDYEAVVLALAKEDQRQNIIYQELHLDYPLNEERGIPLKVVMEGYRSAQKKRKSFMAWRLSTSPDWTGPFPASGACLLSRRSVPIWIWSRGWEWTVRKTVIPVSSIWRAIGRQRKWGCSLPLMPERTAVRTTSRMPC